MTTITEVAGSIDVQQVMSKGSSAEGMYRDVFIINDDVVMKVDVHEDEGQNEQEYDNYINTWKALDNNLVIQNDIKFTVRIPKMEYVGGYIFAERVKFPHLSECRDAWMRDCDHEDCNIINAVDAWCQKKGLYDMHAENFCWDAETETAWIIDMGN